ncbi:MAG TPA: aminoglycoside phosphotransferase family protein [Clostridia bacterium]|nr:aminoglycoside phosphotransferase family protein [Clostridia bacterium]
MEKGELLGKGMTAEVYKWGRDKVLKLYWSNYSEEWVRYEAEIGQKIHEAGVSSPAVFEMVEIDGRKGIIFERVFGKTLTGMIFKQPWLYASCVYQMARFQNTIHRHHTDAIPSQKEKFTRTISLSSGILGDKVERILDYIDRLPDRDNICHGDMYLSNIIDTGDKLVAIDWSSGYRGDPAGDVARTCLIINSPAVLPGTPGILGAMSKFPKALTSSTYLSEYLKASKIRYEDIDAWILPVAAAKLKDRIPGEEKWLMKIIDKRLEQLEV